MYRWGVGGACSIYIYTFAATREERGNDKDRERERSASGVAQSAYDQQKTPVLVHASPVANLVSAPLTYPTLSSFRCAAS